MDAVTTPPNRIQVMNRSHKLLHIQVPTFKGNKSRFNEIEHLLRKHLRSYKYRLREETKLQLFQTLLSKEAIELFSRQRYQRRRR